jgi:glycosyltransferase involved in cell wall biosynthesis
MTNSITLFVMARNEQRAIRRCIESASEFVDEVLMLDTGSKDDTVSIAHEIGAKVIHREWDDDFAASRNFGLSAVRTDYVLSLDADEWLVRGYDTLTNIRQSNTQRVVFEVGMYMGPFDGDEKSISDMTGTFFTPRLFPRDLSYTGRIHEALKHALPVRRTSLLLKHDGYEPAQLARKAGRNLALIQKSLVDDASNPLVYYYFAKELLIQLESSGAPSNHVDLINIADHFLFSIAKTPKNAANRELIIRESLLFFRRYKLFELGIKLIFEALREGSMSHELSFLSTVFLYECVLENTTMNNKLLIDAADGLFFRVVHEIDSRSTTYPFQADLAHLRDLRKSALSKSPV